MAKYVRKLIDDYCVIDLETTGLSFEYSEIIEIGVVKVIDGKIVEKFSTLIKPKYEVDEYITNLTGITNDMLIDAPEFDEIKNKFENFINGFVLVGHNIKFDISFIEKYFNKNFNFECIDTLQISRKIFPNLSNYKLNNIVKELKLSNSTHRSLNDCISTYELYELIKIKVKQNNININDIFLSQKEKEELKEYPISDLNKDEIKSIMIVKEILEKGNKNTKILRTFLQSNGMISICVFGEILKIKCRGRLKYITINKFDEFIYNPKQFKVKSDRLLYDSVEDLYKLSDYITNVYDIIIRENNNYIKNVACGEKNFNHYLKTGYIV